MAFYPEFLTNLVAGLLVIGFGVILGGLLSILVRKILHSFEIERIVQDWGLKFPIEEFISKIIQYGIYAGSLILGLTFLGLQTLVLYGILILLLLILIIFIVLSFKDFIPNMISGVMIYMKNRFKIGDIVELERVEGKIFNIGLLETQIKTDDGDLVIVPNRLISNNIIVKKKK